MKQLYPDYFPLSIDNGDCSLDENILKQYFLKAAIFYEDLSHELVGEVPAYTVGF